MIENINYADMDQALTNLASKNELVIGVGGQTQAAVLQDRQALSQGEVLDRRRQRRRVRAECRRLRRQAGGDRLCRRRRRGDAVEERRGELCRRHGDSLDRQCRQGIRQRAPDRSIPASNISKTIPAISTTSRNPRKRHWPRSPRAPTSTITSSTSACAAWSRRRKEKGTHIIGSYTDRCGTDPLYVAYSITGVGYQVQYAIDEAVAGHGSPATRHSASRWGRRPPAW